MSVLPISIKLEQAECIVKMINGTRKRMKIGRKKRENLLVSHRHRAYLQVPDHNKTFKQLSYLVSHLKKTQIYGKSCSLVHMLKELFVFFCISQQMATLHAICPEVNIKCSQKQIRKE